MLEHGGNLSLAAHQYGIPFEYWLDLSTGINPNGYPIADIPASAWQRLPIDNDGLVMAACNYYGANLHLPPRVRKRLYKCYHKYDRHLN